ncbi:MAG: hypothetical protein NXY57DRAFT_33085 [Lentinula lateritia]|nr:MAG: hypothetical protein NXY57DRAFT_33085 [Lentinula lateritia]
MHEPQLIKGASSVAKLNEKMLASGDNHRKHYPMHIKVPMKPEAIALTWPLMEPNTTSPRKQGRAKICFDVAFDPRKDNNVVVLEGAFRMDSIPYETIRLPASTHCTLTEMSIFLDMEEFNRWPINVMRKDGIRCLDVLEAIHKMLQRPLTDGDVRTFGLAAAQRGMRRVDLLGGRRFFRGLSQSGENWTLHMGSSWY